MKLTVAPRGSGETAKDYAYAVLRENICSLNLAPGCTLNDTEIAKELGISRTPVREAIVQLKNESEIIEIYPQRGMKVALIDIDRVREVRLARLALEREAVRRCCVYAREQDLKELEENVALQQFYYARQDMQKAFELDNLMHRKIFMIAGCGFIYRVFRGPMIHFDRVRSMVSRYESFADSIGDHVRLVKLLREGDQDGAERLIELHLDRWFMNEKKLREEYPDYIAGGDPAEAGEQSS